MHFKEWFKQQVLSESASRPGIKQNLYPPSYGGIGVYPPLDWTPAGADAITYMPDHWYKFKVLYTFKPPSVEANRSPFPYFSIPYYMPLKEAYSYWDGQKKVETNIIILWKDEFAKRPKMIGKVGGSLWDMPMKNADAGYGEAYYIEALTKDEALDHISEVEAHPLLKNVFIYGPGAKAATGIK